MFVEVASPSTHIRSHFPLHPSLSAVDGASTEGEGEVFQAALEAPAHIVIQRVVATQRDAIVSVEQAPNLEDRRAHRDSELFRLGAARNRDAVIVSANDERAIMKRGVKDSFSRRVKVVGVNYSDSGHNVHRQLSSYPNN
jgi:hypothetical protein